MRPLRENDEFFFLFITVLLSSEQYQVRMGRCAHIREILLSFIRLSLYLGNNYDMSDNEYFRLMTELGLQCRAEYYTELRDVIVNRVNIAFSIATYENYIAEMVRKI